MRKSPEKKPERYIRQVESSPIHGAEDLSFMDTVNCHFAAVHAWPFNTINIIEFHFTFDASPSSRLSCA